MSTHDYDIIHASPSGSGRELIIILGQDNINIKLLEEKLRAHGYICRQQSQKKLFIETLLYCQPNIVVIVSWVAPPGIREFIEKARTYHKLKRTHFIIINNEITGKVLFEDKYIHIYTQPVSTNTLIETIKRLPINKDG